MFETMTHKLVDEPILNSVSSLLAFRQIRKRTANVFDVPVPGVDDRQVPEVVGVVSVSVYIVLVEIIVEVFNGVLIFVVVVAVEVDVASDNGSVIKTRQIPGTKNAPKVIRT